MFKKPPVLGNSTALKNSDRRNLQKELSERYRVPLEDCKTVFPDALKQCKATTSAGEHLTVYTAQEPVAIRLGKGDAGPLIPTVYTLWNSQIELPVLVTNDFVLEKLSEGADLFAPGISPRSLATLPEDLPEGSIVGIGTLSVANAVRAIGRLCLHSSKLKQNPQGKAVEILHIEGDQLWALGSKAVAQPKAAPAQAEPPLAGQADGTSATLAAEVDGLHLEDGGKSPAVDGEKDATSELSTTDVDAALKEAVLYAITQLLPKQANAFPLSSSKFMDTYVLPSRRAAVVAAGHDVSIKKSSYKNASAFLKQLKKEGFINTKETKGGEASVVSVDFKHPDTKSFKAYKTVGDAQKQEKKREAREDLQQGKAAQRSVEVSELYKPHGTAVPLCEKLGLGKDDLTLPAELRTMLFDYISSESLINPNDPTYINLNPLLSSALLKKGEDVDFMPRSEVHRRLLDSMQAWHRLVISENGKQEEIVAKGAPKKLSISVKKRQGKKLVTIIEGLETFRIPHQKLAEDLQLKCASSATYGEIQGSSPKKPVYEVVVQGTQTTVVVKELSENWGVPKAWINVVKS